MTNLDLLMIMKLLKTHTNEVIKSNSLVAMGRGEQASAGLAAYRKDINFDMKELKLQIEVAGEKELDFTGLVNNLQEK
tara:strand:- start:48 stop:281 length:234 start_codon:yes stop_codon:yes gene_type:complete